MSRLTMIRNIFVCLVPAFLLLLLAWALLLPPHAWSAGPNAATPFEQTQCAEGDPLCVTRPAPHAIHPPTRSPRITPTPTPASRPAATPAPMSARTNPLPAPAPRESAGERTDGRGNWTYDFSADSLAGQRQLGLEVRALSAPRTELPCFDGFFATYSDEQAASPKLRAAYSAYLLCRNPCLLEKEARDLAQCIDWSEVERDRALVLAGQTPESVRMPWELGCVTPGHHVSPEQGCGPRPRPDQWHCTTACAFDRQTVDTRWGFQVSVRSEGGSRAEALNEVGAACAQTHPAYRPVAARCAWGQDSPEEISASLSFAILEAKRTGASGVLPHAQLDSARSATQFRGYEFEISRSGRILRR